MLFKQHLPVAFVRVIQGRGFVTIPETLNAVDAWLPAIPGNAYANVRQPIISTLNLAHMMPVSAVWAGPEKNAHLDGPPLIVTRTDGATPFRLVTHIDREGDRTWAAEWIEGRLLQEGVSINPDDKAAISDRTADTHDL